MKKYSTILIAALGLFTLAGCEEVLEVELACAEGEAVRVVPISIDRPNFSEPFRRQPDCRYYWLTVLARPQDDRQDNTVAIEAISLRPIRGSS